MIIITEFGGRDAASVTASEMPPLTNHFVNLIWQLRDVRYSACLVFLCFDLSFSAVLK